MISVQRTAHRTARVFVTAGELPEVHERLADASAWRCSDMSITMGSGTCLGYEFRNARAAIDALGDAVADTCSQCGESIPAVHEPAGIPPIGFTNRSGVVCGRCFIGDLPTLLTG